MAVSSSGNNEPASTPKITWQPDWSELDLVFGLAVDTDGDQTLLDPADFGTLPRAGVQLADVAVLGSDAGDRIFAGVGSLIDGSGGDDTLSNTDSQGDNRLLGGIGADLLFLRPVNDRIIGGQLLSGAATFGLSPFTALVDRERDSFLIDSSNPGSTGFLQILDYEPGIDELLIEGVAPSGEWDEVKELLRGLNVSINSAPELKAGPVILELRRGTEITSDLSIYVNDLDGDALQLLKVKGPEWITTSGTTLRATAPLDLTAEQLASIDLQLAFSDGKAAAVFSPQLDLVAAPQPVPVPAPQPDPVPAPQTVPVPAPQPDPVSAPQTVPVPAPQPDPVSAPQTVPVPAPQSDPITGQPLSPSINQITIGIPVEVGTSFKLPRNASESTVILTGSNDINARGNSGDNVLIGNSGSNSLRGAGGNDSLWGREGNDRLKGGKGTDQFIFSSERGLFNVGAEGRDFIVDFKPKQGDRISLSATSFGLASAKGNKFSNSREFAIVSNIDAAAASNASIVYETSSNQLFFNSNSSGSGFGENGGAFALFKNRVDLAADDFSII